MDLLFIIYWAHIKTDKSFIVLFDIANIQEYTKID